MRALHWRWTVGSLPVQWWVCFSLHVDANNNTYTDCCYRRQSTGQIYIPYQPTGQYAPPRNVYYPPTWGASLFDFDKSSRDVISHPRNSLSNRRHRHLRFNIQLRHPNTRHRALFKQLRHHRRLIRSQARHIRLFNSNQFNKLIFNKLARRKVHFRAKRNDVSDALLEH